MKSRQWTCQRQTLFRRTVKQQTQVKHIFTKHQSYLESKGHNPDCFMIWQQWLYNVKRCTQSETSHRVKGQKPTQFWFSWFVCVKPMWYINVTFWML